MAREVCQNVFEVGAIDWGRKLFDELIPLPDGTSYNAYLVRGSEKTALLDTVDPVKSDILIDHLVAAGITKIDYIISHHAEQDHSGGIPDVLAIYPGAKIVTNEKCKDLLIDELHLDEEQFIVISDGETMSLGGKTFEFIFTPWVHWPETFCTYLKEDRVLFSCDFFGSHLAESKLITQGEERVYEAAKRYYAEIMMPFRNIIKKNVDKLCGYDFDFIAPSHGPVYGDADFIINAYKDWLSDEVKNEVVIVFVSMHGSTGRMVDYLSEALIERNIGVKMFNMTGVDIGSLAISLVDAATIVIGSPTMLGGAHPSACYAALLAGALKPKARFFSITGSFGWGGRMCDQLKELARGLKAEYVEGVVIKGCPRDADFVAIDELADIILEKHRGIGTIC
jgi:flavorubredoxin